MRTGYIGKRFDPIMIYSCLLIGLMMFLGCQSKEVPLSPGATAFKKEVKKAVGMVSDALAEPVSKSDVAAINAILKKTMPTSIKLCRACPFMIGVLDGKGVVLAVYPPKKEVSRHYSDYKLIVQALEKGEACHGRLFLQDGAKLYTICFPLLEAGKTVGVIVLTTTDTEVKQRWGISEEEFFAIDFNQ